MVRYNREVIEPDVPQKDFPSSTIVHGSLWALGGQLAVALTTLLTVPFLVRFLGPEAYGIYSLISVIVTYLVFADLGMGVASTRFGSRALSVADREEEARVTWTSVAINAVPTLLIVMILSALASDLLDLFVDVSAPLLKTSAVALQIAAVAYLFRSLTQVLNTPLMTRMRMDLNTRITGLSIIIQSAAIIWVLIAGGGLIAVFFVTLVGSAFSSFATYLVSVRLLPEVATPRADPRLVRPILQFGFPLMISYIASVILGNAEKLFLAYFDSVVSLAHYSLAFTIAGGFALLSGALSQSLVPVFANFQALDLVEEGRALCNNLIRLILIGTLPVAALLMTFAGPFFTVWAGPEYGRESVLPFLILIIGAVVNLLANVPYIILMSYGRSDLVAKYHLIQLGPYLALAGYLTFTMGPIGAALAWTARNFIDLVQLSSAAAGTAVLDIQSIRQRVSGIAWSALILAIPVVIAILHKELQTLFLITFPCITVYAVVSWRVILDDDERSALKRLLRYRI